MKDLPPPANSISNEAPDRSSTPLAKDLGSHNVASHRPNFRNVVYLWKKRSAIRLLFVENDQKKPTVDKHKE